METQTLWHLYFREPAIPNPSSQSKPSLKTNTEGTQPKQPSRMRARTWVLSTPQQIASLASLLEAPLCTWLFFHNINYLSICAWCTYCIDTLYHRLLVLFTSKSIMYLWVSLFVSGIHIKWVFCFIHIERVDINRSTDAVNRAFLESTTTSWSVEVI